MVSQQPNKRQVPRIKKQIRNRYQKTVQWKTAQLSELTIGKSQYGVSDPAMPYNINLPRYIRITDINDEGALSDESKVSTKLTGNEKYVLKHNDLLFARTGSVGRTLLFKEKFGVCIFASYLIRFQINPQKMEPRFLEQYTHSYMYWSWVKSEHTQGVQPNINAKQFSKLKILVPPLAEQRKIASILANIDALIENVEETMSSYGKLKQGLMQQLFTMGVDHSNYQKTVQWKTAQLSELTIGKSQYGVSDPAMPYNINLPRYIRITDINDEGALSDESKVSTKLTGNEKYVLKHNDLLFARTGSVGRTLLFKEKFGVCIFASYLIRFQINPQKMEPRFLEQYTHSYTHELKFV